MLFLLRNIRRKMLTGNNKIASYLLYAVGEIFLVVMGILIAVSIDDWNTSNKEKILEKGYIELLVRDLKADSISLQESIEYSNTVVRSKAIYLSMTKGDPIADSSFQHISHAIFTAFPQFVPNRGAIEEIQNAGGLSLIRNDSLQSQIMDLYNQYETFDRNVAQYHLTNTLRIRELVYEKANGENVFYSSDGFNPTALMQLAMDGDIRNRVINNWAVTYNHSLKQLSKINSETIHQCLLHLYNLD